MNENIQFFRRKKNCTLKLNFCFIKFAGKFGVHFKQQPLQKVQKKQKFLSQKFYNLKILRS